VLERLGPKLERGRLKQVVEGIEQLNLGIQEKVTFGPGRHQGLDQVYFTEVEAGRFVRVTSWEKWRP
jgi:hypothetical protein